MWKYTCCVLFLQIIVQQGEGVSFVQPNSVVRHLLVPTDNGYIQGRTKNTYNGKKFWAYQGIPFAQPPIGNLRFRASVPSRPWDGVLDATEEGLSCVETFPTVSGIIVSGDEDCLYLNVYAPENPQNAKELKPVLVWIYGGAFTFGNSSSKFYGPDNFLDRDIVVVTFNYRVGLFGFLSTMDTESPGNYGLKDQNLALKWVQRNIRNFGGDKNRVTIAGQSAGAASVFYHMTSPKSKGLFHGVIASSGSPLCSWAYQRNPKRVAFDIGLAAGIRTNNTRDLVAALRKVDVVKLKKVSKLIVLLFIPQSDREGFPFGPSMETNHRDAFVTATAISALEKGKFNRVPILMGSNTLETMLFDAGKWGVVSTVCFGISAGASPISNLVNLPSTIGYKNDYFIQYIPRYDQGGLPFGPTIEPNSKEAFITNGAMSAFKSGKFNRVPILMGSNTLEVMFFAELFDLIRPLNLIYDLSPGSLPSPTMNIRTPEERRRVGLMIKKLYFKRGSYIEATKKETLEYTSDDRFIRPMRKTAQLASRYTPLYNYVFSYESDYGLNILKGILNSRPVHGVAHLEEEAFIWKKSGVSPPEGIDKLMSLRVMQMWSNFIKTRNPTPVRDELLQGVVWRRVESPNNISYLEIDRNLSMKYNYRQMYMESWERLYKVYGNGPYSTY